MNSLAQKSKPITSTNPTLTHRNVISLAPELDIETEEPENIYPEEGLLIAVSPSKSNHRGKTSKVSFQAIQC